MSYANSAQQILNRFSKSDCADLDDQKNFILSKSN